MCLSVAEWDHTGQYAQVINTTVTEICMNYTMPTIIIFYSYTQQSALLSNSLATDL